MISYSSLICVHQVAQSVNSSLICVHQVAQSVIDPNVIEGGGNMTTAQEDRSNRLYSEVIVCIFTLILLVWLMNREFEISYRLSYHCSKLSQRDRRKIQTLKNQADWLLHNIIPRYVNKLSIKYYHYQRNILWKILKHNLRNRWYNISSSYQPNVIELNNMTIAQEDSRNYVLMSDRSNCLYSKVIFCIFTLILYTLRCRITVESR